MDAAAWAADDLVNEVIKVAEISPEQVLGVGAAVPGPLDPATGTVSRSSMVPSWTGTEIAAERGRHLGYPVWADNESNCGALAEWMWGAGQPAKSMAYLKLHSGIGGGLVMGGRLVRGSQGRPASLATSSSIEEAPSAGAADGDAWRPMWGSQP